MEVPATGKNFEAITITAWVNGASTGDFTGLIQSRDPDQTIGIGYNFTAEGNLQYHWNDNNANTWGFPSGLTIPKNEWTFVALSLRPDQARLYVGARDGGELNFATNAIPQLPQQNSATSWHFGKDNLPADARRHFDGLMDDIAIWDGALSDGELLALFKGIETPLTIRPEIPLDPDIASAMIHQYRFNETEGRLVKDTVSGADGEIKGDGFSWNHGKLTLDGGDKDSAAYVDLPNGLVSGLNSTSIEMWVTVDGETPFWPRVFDFGSTTIGEIDGPGGGAYRGDGSIFFSAGVWHIFDQQAFSISIPGEEVDLDANLYADIETKFHVPYHALVTFDGDTGIQRYYRDGKLAGEHMKNVSLSAIEDVNNWLGRSQFDNDGNLAGRLDEFRIYNRALTEEEVSMSFAAGPDAEVGPVTPPVSGPLDPIGDVYVTASGNIAFNLPDGLTADIEFSTDLIEWEVIAEGVTEMFEDADPARTVLTEGYYRAKR